MNCKHAKYHVAYTSLSQAIFGGRMLSHFGKRVFQRWKTQQPTLLSLAPLEVVVMTQLPMPTVMTKLAYKFHRRLFPHDWWTIDQIWFRWWDVLNERWPRLRTHICVTRPKCVNYTFYSSHDLIDFLTSWSVYINFSYVIMLSGIYHCSNPHTSIILSRWSYLIIYNLSFVVLPVCLCPRYFQTNMTF